MTKVSKSFVCTVEAAQINQLVWIMDRTSMDIGDGASLELMNKFCYVGDMLSVNGDADAAVEARVHVPSCLWPSQKRAYLFEQMSSSCRISKNI